MSDNTLYAWGIVVNWREATKYVRAGARCYVTWDNPGWGGERLQVWVRSRGGRAIVIMRAAKKLTNYRAAWIPVHVRSWPNVLYCLFKTREEAAERAALWQREYGGSTLCNKLPK